MSADSPEKTQDVIAMLSPEQQIAQELGQRMVAAQVYLTRMKVALRDDQVDAGAMAFALCKMLSQVIAALPQQHQRKSLELMHSDLDRLCGMNTVMPVRVQ